MRIMRHWRSVSGAHGCSATPPSLKGGKCKVEESRGGGCKVGEEGREGRIEPDSSNLKPGIIIHTRTGQALNKEFNLIFPR